MSETTRTVSGLHKELPLPQAPGYAGYWTFVTAITIVMFVFFLAQKGHLQTWISFLSWSQPQDLGQVGASSSSNNATRSNNATPADPTQGPASGLPGGSVMNWFGNFGSFLLHPFAGTK